MDLFNAPSGDIPCPLGLTSVEQSLDQRDTLFERI